MKQRYLLLAVLSLLFILVVTFSRLPALSAAGTGPASAAAARAGQHLTQVLTGDLPVFVKDINAASYSSGPGEIVVVNGIAYASASYTELWRSDGTAQGTNVVHDFGGETYFLGMSEWGPYALTAGPSDLLFFNAGDEAHGRELWASDGTESGTYMVKDIWPGVTGSSPANLVVLNGFVYFTAGDDANGSALWRSDGTEAGTTLVKPLSGIFELTPAGGFLYFIYDPDGGADQHAELWRSDGTESGTGLVKGFDWDYGWRPSELTLAGDTLYFAAHDGVHGRELWKSDGTIAGTILVKEIAPGAEADAEPTGLVGMDGIVYFAAYDPLNGESLWRSDGSDAGTYLVKDVAPYRNSTGRVEIAVMNSALYFPARDDAGQGLWRSDGTTGGTVKVADIEPSDPYGAEYANLTAGETLLYFAGTDETYGTELWRSDGTGAGTLLVEDIYPGVELDYPRPNNALPQSLAADGDRLYFSAEDGFHGRELWMSDGTAAGTALVEDLEAATYGADPQYITLIGDMLYFYAYDGSHGRELWRSDGTAPGTSLVKDIWPGPQCPDEGYECKAAPMAAVGSTLYLGINDGQHGTELWRSDGTEAGTSLVKDIRPGSYGSMIDYHSPQSWTGEMLAAGNTLYFVADDGSHGPELWRSDGTEAGTTLVKDINPGSYGSVPATLTYLDGILYFSAFDETHGRELWRSDGTEAGTTLVKEINPTGDGMGSSTVVSLDGVLYFAGTDGTDAVQLWRSDGSAAGTYLVKELTTYYDLTPDSFSAMVAAGDTLYIFVGKFYDGMELWRSDGTEGGTQLVKAITSVDGSSAISAIVVDDTLFFSAGSQLWRSDGTEGGTAIVYEYSSASPWGGASALTAAFGGLYMRAGDGVHGEELWRSDGTEGGTVMVADLNPGESGANPASLTLAGDVLYFVASDGFHGRELWRIGSPSFEPVTAASLAGPAPGTVGSSQTFTASAIPSSATLPLTFTWQATGFEPVTHIVEERSDTISFTWEVTGTKKLTVTVANAEGSAQADHTLQIFEGTLTTLVPGVPQDFVLPDDGLTTTLQFGADAVTETTTLLYRSLSGVDGVVPLQFAGRAFDLDAYRNGVLLPDFTFSWWARVTLAYDPLLGDALRLDELKLYWWDGGAWINAATTCPSPADQIWDGTSNSVIAFICRTGRYALLGPAAKESLYLPLILR